MLTYVRTYIHSTYVYKSKLVKKNRRRLKKIKNKQTNWTDFNVSQ